jgi:hypothetical protein
MHEGNALALSSKHTHPDAYLEEGETTVLAVPIRAPEKDIYSSFTNLMPGAVVGCVEVRDAQPWRLPHPCNTPWLEPTARTCAQLHSAYGTHSRPSLRCVGSLNWVGRVGLRPRQDTVCPPTRSRLCAIESFLPQPPRRASHWGVVACRASLTVSPTVVSPTEPPSLRFAPPPSPPPLLRRWSIAAPARTRKRTSSS